MSTQSYKRLAGPAFLSNSAANIYTQNALIYDIVRHIRLTNITGSAATAILYIGATGGSVTSTEYLNTSIPANSSIDIYCSLKLTGAVDFLSGVSGTSSAITIVVEGESGVI